MTVSFAVLCVGPPRSSKRYFSPRNTCIVEETCSANSFAYNQCRATSVFFIFTTPPLRQSFRSSFDKQTGPFPLDRWSVFLLHGGLVKAIPPCTIYFNYVRICVLHGKCNVYLEGATRIKLRIPFHLFGCGVHDLPALFLIRIGVATTSQQQIPINLSIEIDGEWRWRYLRRI